MKSLAPFLAVLSLAVLGHAAETKKIIVCTVTYGYRHDSIPPAEKTLQRLGEESGAFKVVELVNQPTLPRMRKPTAPAKPGDLKPDTDEKAKAQPAEEMKKFAV